jgi:hypothetical protein
VHSRAKQKGARGSIQEGDDPNGAIAFVVLHIAIPVFDIDFGCGRFRRRR